MSVFWSVRKFGPPPPPLRETFSLRSASKGEVGRVCFPAPPPLRQKFSLRSASKGEVGGCTFLPPHPYVKSSLLDLPLKVR